MEILERQLQKNFCRSDYENWLAIFMKIGLQFL